jgi:hypothetical protein
MHKNGNPGAVSPARGADCNAQQLSNLSANRAENKAPIVGRRFGHWTAVQADDTGKRIHAKCVCGRVRVLGLDSLEAGETSSCGCQPPTLQDRAAFRAERERQARRAVQR